METHHGPIAKALFAENLSASAIARRTGLSQPTVSRALKKLPVIKLGKGRASLYAWVDAIEGHPVYTINPKGQTQRLAILHRQPDGRVLLIHDEGYTVYDDLPWFLNSVLPAGFLGRLHGKYLSKRLAINRNPARWSANEAFRYLLYEADDLAGNLLIGKGSVRLYQQRREEYEPIESAQYDAIAAQINQRGIAVSSVAGEQPKFLAYTQSGAESYHSIIKYSSPFESQTPAAQRYRDLLMAEHLALECLQQHSVSASRSRLLEGERLHLEVRRFDRIGEYGRRGIVSLRDLDAEYIGDSVHWYEAADALQRLQLIDEVTQQQVHLLYAFGVFIGNTDMHFGNLSFYFEDFTVRGLTPVYDMLPMIYMPIRDEVVIREFKPAPVFGVDADIQQQASKMAETYWQQVSEDHRLSAEFRRLAAANKTLLNQLLP